MEHDNKGPFIVWTDYGCEGWHPTSYATLKEAVSAPRYNSRVTITRLVEFDVSEKDAPTATASSLHKATAPALEAVSAAAAPPNPAA